MDAPHVLKLHTEMSPESLATELRRHEPWGHRIDFDNGISTSQLKRRTPFNENLLIKFESAAAHIPFQDLSGGSLLDIGCNSGHNSIHAATTYGMHPVGVEVSERHMQASSFLADLAGVEAEFVLANAETFSRPAAFDVVLHFGTLYHLPNPLLSLNTTYDNLKPGGYLALETQTYDDPDNPCLCSFVHMQNDDPTNFWAISEHVLGRYLAFIGFESIVTAMKASPKMLPRHQHRTIIVARKPSGD